RFFGREEHRVLLQIAEKVEFAGDQMPPGAHDGKLVIGQVERVLLDKGLDQVSVVEQGVTDLEPNFRGQGGEVFRVGKIVGKHLEELVDEEHQRPVQPEEQGDILWVEQHGRSPILKAPPPEATTAAANSLIRNPLLSQEQPFTISPAISLGTRCV